MTVPVGFWGEIVKAAVPRPDSTTVCGLLAAPSLKLRVAARVPPAVGVKTTEAEQLAEAARLPPQVMAETEKSVAFGPLMATLPIVNGVTSLLVSVAACGALLDPTAVAANERLEGPTIVGTAPRPVRETV